MSELKRVLMIRDEITAEEADERINEVREMIANDTDNAEDIILEELGLELDYIFDLI